MPIRFRCPSCTRKLSVGSKKAGESVRCPKCGEVISVPTADEADATSAMSEALGTSSEPSFEFEVDVEAQPSRPASEPQVPVDLDLVSIPRTILYAQGVLIATVALLAFAAGYWTGSGSSTAVGEAAENLGPIQIVGSLTRDDSGDEVGEEGAVLLLLPRDKTPDDKIDARDWGPLAEGPQPGEQALQRLQILGGIYQRTGEGGSFAFVVPRAGDYYVTRISHSTRRQGDLNVNDVKILGSYLKGVPDLLGDRQYTFATITIEPGTKLDYNFVGNPR